MRRRDALTHPIRPRFEEHPPKQRGSDLVDRLRAIPAERERLEKKRDRTRSTTEWRTTDDALRELDAEERIAKRDLDGARQIDGRAYEDFRRRVDAHAAGVSADLVVAANPQMQQLGPIVSEIRRLRVEAEANGAKEYQPIFASLIALEAHLEDWRTSVLPNAEHFLREERNG